MSKSPIPTDTAGLIQHLLEVVRDQRTTLLVDRLCDLRGEMLTVIDQLADHDFDAFEFLSGFDDDDDAADCDFAQDRGRAAVH